MIEGRGSSGAQVEIEFDVHPALDHDLTVNDMWDELECDRYQNPIHGPDDWKKMRDTYHEVLEEENKLHPTKEGFQFPIDVRYVPGKGRGVFVAKGITIPQGALVWSRHQTATFDDGMFYRHFLASLPINLACDILQWAYVQDFGSGLQIAVDLDEGSFMNSAWEDEVEANVGCGYGRCDGNLFAKRELKGGEEIVCDYEDFAVGLGWKQFGLL